MPELVSVKLTSPQLRAVLDSVANTLKESGFLRPENTVGEDLILLAFAALVRAQLGEAGWRPQGVELDYWAVEALARITAPPPAPKPARAAKKAAAAAPKRRRADARRRHDRPAARAAESEPPIPLADDGDADISDEVLQ